MEKKSFIGALSVFIGTIVGVGIFGLPYIALKSGFLLVIIYFLFLSIVAIFIHWLYAKVCLGTDGVHRFPGYIRQYLGKTWEKVSFLNLGVGLTGALLAYLIVGGEFLKLLFSNWFGGNSLIYSLIFFSFGSYLIFKGIKSVSQIETWLIIALFVLLFVFFIKTFPFINTDYFAAVNPKNFFLPYGVILFSLWGSALVPEVKEMLKGDGIALKKLIIFGIIISTLIYLFFIYIIFGSCGNSTSKEAISGLSIVLGDNIIKFGFIFGVLACFTSFIALGLTLKKVFWYDFGFSKNLSWFIACFLPLFLFLIGLREFIEIIGFIGAVAIGIEGILVVFLYKQFLKQKYSYKMNPVYYLLSMLFILGIVFEIFYFFNL